MTSETPPPSVSTTTTTVPTAPPEHLVSRLAFRMMERSSTMLFALASTSKNSQVSRLSLAANELLREICERKVDKKTIEQLEFFVVSDRLKEEAAEPVVILAKSILAIGRSIGGLENTVDATPACRVKPPLDFGDGDDGADNMFLAPSGTWTKKKVPLFRNEENADLNTSDNTETTEASASSGDKKKPVSAEDDWCVTMPAVATFRPLTPEGDRKELSLSPSPPPSPTIQTLLKRNRGRMEYESEQEEEFYDDEDQTTPIDNTTASSSVEKDGVQCPMCDTFFYAQHQLDSHLVAYHRMKPSFGGGDANDTLNDDGVSPSRRPSVGGSAAILSTRPLDGFGQPQHQRLSGGGTAQVRATEQLRVTSTAVTSPGGTIRHYSSASNAARAAAKAAAAAANGVFRPNVPSKPYTCRQCGVVLTSQQMYASHVRYNHPKEKMDGVAGGTPAAPRQRSSTANKETAIVHLQMDDGTKAFKCRRCDKIFDSAQKVAGHSRHCLLVFEGKARPANQGPVPTEDRPYTVYRCGLNSDLARTCPYCGELLPSIRKVDKHVRLVHEAGRHEVYGCSTCDRRFVTLGGIENHWLHYGDCPQGVLTVHKDDGSITCADIGECPPPIKRPKIVQQIHAMSLSASGHASAKHEMSMMEDEDEDPSVAIVQAIMAAHKKEIGNHNAPNLSPELGDASPMKTDGEEDEEEEAAPVLDEYGEGDEEMMNGDFHLEEEMEEEVETEVKPVIKSEDKPEKLGVSMKIVKCKQCKFIATSRDDIDKHMIEAHPDEAPEEKTSSPPLEDEEDGLPTTTSVSPELNDDAIDGSTSAASDDKTKQTGEMRRMLGIAAD